MTGRSGRTALPWLSRLARVGAAVVGMGAAVLSYRATSAVAAASGAVSPRWAWLVPVIIEAGMVTAGALAWLRVTAGERGRAETTLAGVLLGLSVVVQIADARAHHATLLGQVLAALPPVVLLGSAEMITRECRRTAGRNAAPTPRKAATARSRPRLAEEGTPLSAPVAAAPALWAVPPVADRQAAIERLAAEHGGGLTGATVARELGVHPATGRRWLAEWRAGDDRPA